MNYQKLWEQLQTLLETALNQEQTRLPATDVSKIQHFIDHREYGLAWDELAAALSELKLTPNEHTRKAMHEAASLMYPEGR
ncbi:hypothetical protein [Inquilinus sp. CA228]|uniref:hypothetical protein n=1 Tax=Inquilinus sp. CA228 TaxID=3455609 RepID=UPI003F8D4E72